MNKPLTHPLKWWQFYVECIRYAGSGLLGVIGDAGTILAAGIFGVKLVWPVYYASAAAYLKSRGLREDLLIELPLWIGALILIGRFTAAPFMIYRSKPFTKSLNLSRPQVKLSAVLAKNDNARVTYFEIKNYGNAVAVNISFEIPMPLSQDVIRFDISSLGPDESLRFLPHMFRDGKRWGMNEQFPIEEFMKRAAFTANMSRAVDAAVAAVEQARMPAAPAVPREAMSVADPPRREPMIVPFDVHYLDFARTTRFRTPHVLTYDPSLPIVWDSLEPFIRIDLSSEPESEPSTVMVAPESGVRSSASLRSG